MWNAGLGDLAYNKLGWKTAAVVADDYSFGWTSAAGFIAEFCAVGGKVTKRVFPPLNTTDYSSYAQQMPTNVDGTFVAVGGAGLIPFLKAYEQAHGPIDGKKFIGNLFWGTPGEFEQLGTRVAGAYVGGAGTAGDLATPAAKAYNAEVGKGFKTIPPFGAAAPQASSTFTYGYYVNTWGLLEGLKAVGGDISGGQKALQAAIAKVVARRPPYGPLHLDKNRQAVINVFYQQLYLKGGKLAIKTVGEVPGVDQTFGGTFSPTHAGSGTDLPDVREAEPAVDRQDASSEGHRLGESSDRKQQQLEHAEPILRLRGIGRRFGGLHAVRDVDLDVAHGERRAILGPNGAGKTTLFNVISGDVPPSVGHDRVPGRRRHAAPAARAREARDGPDVPEVPPLPRPLGRGQPLPRRARRADAGHLRPVVLSQARRRAARARARARRAPSASTAASSARSSARSRTASSASSRSAWRAASNPTLMMLDEPASGLSRGERVALTELLLELDPAITLILIEHDMDVALRVAERVTMMHDGRVIVEGTPDEIRANQTVHDLYLGQGPSARCLTPLLAVEGVSAFYGTRAGARGRVVRDGRRVASRSSAATAWARRRCATRSSACRPPRVTRLDPVPGHGARRQPSYKIAKLGIGYVPQGRRLFPSLSRRRAPADDPRPQTARRSAGRVERVYELFPRLAERKRNGGAQLSGGEQQMLAIGRALLTNPTLLVMDEPSEGSRRRSSST